MKKTTLDILYALDQDHLKTHKSHTKKINHLCATLMFGPDVDAPTLLVVQPPDCADKTIQLVFHSRYFIGNDPSNPIIPVRMVIRFKEKQTSRNTIACRTKEAVQDCLDKKYKIYDCTVENDASTPKKLQYTRYLLDIIGKIIWRQLQSEREVFKQKVLLDRSCETDLETMDFTDLHGLDLESHSIATYGGAKVDVSEYKEPTYEDKMRDAEYRKKHDPMPMVKLDEWGEHHWDDPKPSKPSKFTIGAKKKTTRAEVRKAIKECTEKRFPMKG